MCDTSTQQGDADSFDPDAAVAKIEADLRTEAMDKKSNKMKTHKST